MATVNGKHTISILLRTFVCVAVLVPTITARAAGGEPVERSDGKRFFADSIEPLLKRYCFECHSHRAGEMGGGLTLDSRVGWSTGGDHGAAIAPGKPEKSLLIQAIRRRDRNLQMPPDEKLPDSAIKLFEQWVKRGAPDPREKPLRTDVGDPLDWWSLRPLKRPAVPSVQSAAEVCKNQIDSFVQQKLQSQGLMQVSRADRRVLIRRLYFNLHGLPPSPQAVASFVADPDPRAYVNLVDRLLDSPRYGERWARHWLDTVHFADSHGCEHDVFRPNAYRYRDYVVTSFNRDTPWPRFIREQLAADRFFPGRPELTPALGFIAAGPLELSRAGTAPVTFDYLDRDDMVAQTMAAFTSSTANCARCHDHKFDPISQEDYYALQTVFAGVGKGDVEFDENPDVAKARHRWRELLAAAHSRDPTVLLAPEFADVVAQWERIIANQSAVWEPLSPSKAESSSGTKLSVLDDGSILACGTRPETDTYKITLETSLSKLTAIRLDVLADDRLPMKGPGRQDNGNLHLSEFEAFALNAEDADPIRLKIRNATADWNQAGWTISHALDGNEATAWGIYPKVGQSHHAVFELQDPCSLASSTQIVVLLKQLHGGGHLIGRPKLYATDAPDAAAIVLPESVRTAIEIPPDQRKQDQQVAVAAHALKQHAERQLAALPKPSAVYAVSSRFSHAKKLDSPMRPKVVHVLRRGDIHQPGEIARPGALSVITGLPGRFELRDPSDEAARRAALADWLAARDNPLTWRSIVNRVWSFHFGRGLCDTPNDFGRMGGVPSHPALLDWLAVWFRDDAGGSLKRLHRLILMSSTFQRQSRVGRLDNLPDDARDPRSVDADNRMLWRMTRRPLDAESYRDAVLQICGRIDLTMGGPGVQQFTQSKGAQATPKLDYDAYDWNHPSAARRSIYRVVWRGIADPFMEALDFPDLGLLVSKRAYSVSALQALATFNNDFVLHHSRLLAERLEAENDALGDQLKQACRLIYLREPSEDEVSMLSRYTRQHGLAATCRVLFNSNEFMFVE